MNPIPPSIIAVLRRYQVLSLAVVEGGHPWAASVFFAGSEDDTRLVFLTALDTRHGHAMLAQPEVAGTISAQFSEIADIHGLQLQGMARLIEEPAALAAALELYYTRYPLVRGMSAPAWEIELHHLKLVDNRLGFGTKILWNRHEGETSPGLSCATYCTTRDITL